MSANPCGCDPEARWQCRDYPDCVYGRVEDKRHASNHGITLNAFQASIARIYRPNNSACHGLGIAGEAGEVADIIKKVLFHDNLTIGEGFVNSPRRDDMCKELGDVLWYVAAVASDWGFTLEEVAQGNIDKLAARYPNGFVKGGGVRALAPNPWVPAQPAPSLAEECASQGMVAIVPNEHHICGCQIVDGLYTPCNKGESGHTSIMAMGALNAKDYAYTGA